MKKKHRDYQNNYFSTTEVCDAWRKKDLEFWFKFNTLEYINAESEKAKSIGTVLHKCIQNLIENNNEEVETLYADEVNIAISSFQLFHKEHPEIKLKRSEIQLTSEKWKYNGTIDVEEARPKIGDWKTGKCAYKEKGEIKYHDKPPIYESMIIQLSAYYKLWEEHFKVKLDGGWIAVFSKDKIAYNFLELGRKTLDAYFKHCFLTALDKLYFIKSVKQVK